DHRRRQIDGRDVRAAPGQRAAAPALAAADVERPQVADVAARRQERRAVEAFAVDVLSAADEPGPAPRDLRPRLTNVLGRAAREPFPRPPAMHRRHSSQTLLGRQRRAAACQPLSQTPVGWSAGWYRTRTSGLIVPWRSASMTQT